MLLRMGSIALNIRAFICIIVSTAQDNLQSKLWIGAYYDTADGQLKWVTADDRGEPVTRKYGKVVEWEEQGCVTLGNWIAYEWDTTWSPQNCDTVDAKTMFICENQVRKCHILNVVHHHHSTCMSSFHHYLTTY
jgi:hypothetical protein